MKPWQYIVEILACLVVCFIFMLGGRLSTKNHPILTFLINGIGFLGFAIYIALVRNGTI